MNSILKIYYMAFTEINVQMCCFLGFLSQKGFWRWIGAYSDRTVNSRSSHKHVLMLHTSCCTRGTHDPPIALHGSCLLFQSIAGSRRAGWVFQTSDSCRLQVLSAKQSAKGKSPWPSGQSAQSIGGASNDTINCHSLNVFDVQHYHLTHLETWLCWISARLFTPFSIKTCFLKVHSLDLETINQLERFHI